MTPIRQLIEQATIPSGIPTMNKPTLIADAKKRREASDEIAERCSPTTMLAVVEALDWATWSGGGPDKDQYYCAGCGEHHLDFEKIIHKPACVISKAISLLNGHPAPAPQPEKE